MEVLLSILATWRICKLVIDEEGPFNIFGRLRQKIDHKILDCSYCLSVWVAFPFALLLSDGIYIPIYWLGISAGAIIIEEVINGL